MLVKKWYEMRVRLGAGVGGVGWGLVVRSHAERDVWQMHEVNNLNA